MSKKKSFEDAFLNIGNEVKTKENIKTEQTIEKFKPIIEDVKTKEEVRVVNQEVFYTSTIINEITLHQYVQQKVQELENKINEQTGSKFKPKKRLSYSDKYVGITISIRPELKAIIEDIRYRTTMDKYEIIELLIMSGLKSINFDEE